jgi:hypothetical protein
MWTARPGIYQEQPLCKGVQRMSGTTGLAPDASGATIGGVQVISTAWRRGLGRKKESGLTSIHKSTHSSYSR